MNSCILMVEIIQEPQLRFTADNLEVTEMLVQFPSSREGDPPCTLKVVGWGNTAKEIQQNYHQGDRVLLEGRLSMNTIERPEGFKEKRAELTVQRIHSLGTAINTISSSVASAPLPVTSTQTVSTYNPVPTPTPATSRVNVPQDTVEQQRAPQSTHFERNTYSEVPTEEPDPDDIPF